MERPNNVVPRDFFGLAEVGLTAKDSLEFRNKLIFLQSLRSDKIVLGTALLNCKDNAIARQPLQFPLDHIKIGKVNGEVSQVRPNGKYGARGFPSPSKIRFDQISRFQAHSGTRSSTQANAEFVCSKPIESKTAEMNFICPPMMSLIILSALGSSSNNSPKRHDP
jgi:hypothetical protein